MPDENFRLEQRSSLFKSQISSVGEGDWDDYEELFDDFVMIDKDMVKYNAPPKLQKEKSQMNSGPS